MLKLCSFFSLNDYFQNNTSWDYNKYGIKEAIRES